MVFFHLDGNPQEKPLMHKVNWKSNTCYCSKACVVGKTPDFRKRRFLFALPFRLEAAQVQLAAMPAPAPAELPAVSPETQRALN